MPLVGVSKNNPKFQMQWNVFGTVIWLKLKEML